VPDKAAQIEQNLQTVRERIASACARSHRLPDTVRLIAATKYVGVEEIRILQALGVTDFGENRVHDAQPKIEAIGRDVCWHMIGTVQRRKARDIVAWFDSVDSVDRVEVAQALEKRCALQERTLPVLLEVNVSGEESKHGFAPEDLAAVVEQVGAMEHIQLRGLMTMAPFYDDPDRTRPVFARLTELAETIGLPERSMGMTNDYEVAIEEGATQVRIGSALF